MREAEVDSGLRASCWRFSDLNRIDDNTFVGSHPSKNPPRTFGGQMMAQAFVAASRTLIRDLPAGAISAHFIAGGDPEKDLEFHVVRLRDERRFANRRVDVMQDGELLTTAMVSFVDGGRGLEHGIEPPEVPDPLSLPKIDDLLRGLRETVPQFVERAAADRMAVHQRPGLGDAGQGRTARPQPGVAEGRRADAGRPGAACRRAGVLLGHHGARLDHHHPRPVVGLRPHLRGDGQPLGVVPPADPVRRVGAVLDVLAGGGRLARPGNRPFLRPIRANAWLPWCRKESSSTSRVQSR